MRRIGRNGGKNGNKREGRKKTKWNERKIKLF